MDLQKGVLKRKNGTYSVKPRMRLGFADAATIERVAKAVRELELPGVRINAAQRLMFEGVPEEKLERLLEIVGETGQDCPHFVVACPGNTACRMGVADSLAFGRKLEAAIKDLEFPAKVKTGVSGCHMCCTECFVRDIGLMAKKDGWTVIFGGNAGRNVRKGDVIAEKLEDDAALETILRLLDFYAKNAKKRERTSVFADRVGLEALLEAARD